MGQKPVDYQSARRRTVTCMFVALMVGIFAFAVALMYAANNLPDDQFVGGIILTAMAGAMGSFLSLIGIIVKGVVDNLTKQDDEQKES